MSTKHPRIDLNEFSEPNDLLAVHRLAGNNQWARVFLLEINSPPLAIIRPPTTFGDGYVVYVAKCKCAPVCDVRMKALAYATDRYQSATVVELAAARSR